ncbi:MAG TPA: PAS domain S-box protein [Puia sp.]
MENDDFELNPFFELTPDLVCVAGKDGYFRKINHAVIHKLEYSREELFSRPISSFIHPEDRKITEQERKELLGGKPLINFENRYISKSGKIIWLHWTSVYIPDREVVFAISKDVTERKTIDREIEEKYKKFKSLTTYYKSSIEKDRKYLAIELHEELAQLASVVKMDIDWIENNSPDLSALTKNRIGHALSVSDLLISAIRRISFSISPRMLDDLGLNETLIWLCSEFAILNGIPCEFESDYNEADLTHEIKLDFFRICQESLTSVMYHVLASSVKISIVASEDKICLSIFDNGEGFNIEQQNQTSVWTGISERVASINGHLTIKNEFGKGTTIQVSINKPPLSTQ